MIEVVNLNHTFVKVNAEASIQAELSEYFSFYADGYKFHPAFKNRLWDGKVRLFNRKTGEIYRGLVHYIRQFCDERSYGFSYVCEDVSSHDFVSFYSGLPTKFSPRDYQKEAFEHAAKEARALLLSPTGSGKSFIIYMLQQYHGVRTLILVPTVSLVEQMTNDLIDYGFDGSIQKIMSGREKNVTCDVTISTWQSLFKMPKEYFEAFECIIVDEAHTAKANSIKGIMEKCGHIQYRFGLTGTLDGGKCNRLTLEGLFGEVKQVTTSAKLIKEGTLSQMEIRSLVLSQDGIKGKMDYQSEVKFLNENPKRNKFISNLALATKGITLVLFDRISHGKELKEMIKEKREKTFFVSGEISSDVREGIRRLCEKEDDIVLVCSYGTTSTGVNIPRISNIIFASAGKSQIRVLQSVGRGLRKASDKDKLIVFDLCDKLNTRGTNYSLKHFEERYKYYKDQKFPVSIKEIEI